MSIRTAKAEWKDGLRGGDGVFGGASGVVEGVYTFPSRFEEAGGTNPEELVAAAHASCYSMFLAAVLEEGGNAPESVRTEADVHIVEVGDGFEITRIDLATVGRVPGIDAGAFQEAAEFAKANCPISKALAAVPAINLEATLEQ